MDRSTNFLMHAASKAILPEVWNDRQGNYFTGDGATRGNSIVYNNGIYWSIINEYWGTWQASQPIVRYSTDLKNWNIVTISGLPDWGSSTGLSTLGVAANGNTIIVVGGSISSPNHRIWRSGDNGTTWTTVKSSSINGQSDAYYKIMFANGKWLAMSNKGMSVSNDDGITWTDYAATSPGPYANVYTFDRIVYANNLWIIAGTNGKIYTHSTLTNSNWTEYTVTPAGTETIKSVEYINGTYVAAYAWQLVYSTDLVNWSTASINRDSYSDNYMMGVLRIGKFSVGGTTERLVATGYPRKLHYSDNGSTWTSINLSIFNAPGYSTAYYQSLSITDFFNGPNNTIIYVDNKLNYASSSNGSTWSLIANNNTWSDIVYNPISAKFFAVKVGGSPLLGSFNGLDWTFQSTLEPNTWKSPKDIKFNNTWQYGVDHHVSGGRYTTDFGNNWTNYTESASYGVNSDPESDYLTSIVWTGQYFYLIGYDSFKRIVPTSLGLTSWTSTTPSFMQYGLVTDAESNGSGSIVVVPSQTAGTLVVSSNHGTNWTHNNNSGWQSSRQAAATAYSSDLNMLVTVGRYDYISRSTDNGVTWTFATFSGQSFNYNCVTWTGSRFIAGGSYTSAFGTSSPVKATSIDGITWTYSSFGQAADYMYDIVTNKQKSLTVGVCGGNSSYAFVSTDQGVNWNRYSMASTPAAVCFVSEGTLIAYGTGGWPSYEFRVQNSTNSGQTWTNRYYNTNLELIAPTPAYENAVGMRPVLSEYDNRIIIFCLNKTTRQVGVLLSTDAGNNWTLNYISGLYNAKIQAYWDDYWLQFVAHTNIGRKYTSTDGINWTQTLLPTTAYFPPPRDFIVQRYPGEITYNVENSSNSGWLFSNLSLGINPGITLSRGKTYYFSINAPGHPFWIKTYLTTGTEGAYSYGVTNNGTENGIVTFSVPLDAPDTLFYICQFHAPMSGLINIVNTKIWGDQESRAYGTGISETTWQVNNTIFGWKPRKIFWDGSRYIMIAFNTTYIFTATDPSYSWTPFSNVTIPGDSNISGNLSLVSIKYNSAKTKYYLSAVDLLTKVSYILSSSDLTSWTVKSAKTYTRSSNTLLYSAAFSPTRSVFVGNNNTLISSP